MTLATTDKSAGVRTQLALVSPTGSGLTSRPAERRRAPGIFTSGPETLPGSSLPRLSMSRSNVPVSESAPQSSSAFAEPE